LLIVILLATGAMLVATLLGLIAMSEAGAADKALSEPLLCTRVGLQALTLLLVIAAILRRRLKQPLSQPDDGRPETPS
jgi:hypothetical protein